MKSPSPFITLAPGPGTGAAFVKYDKKALFTLVSIVGAVGVNSVSERLAMRIVPIVLLLTVLSAAQTDTRVWHVRIGTEGDTRLSVSSSAGVIEFRNDTAVVFTIPVWRLSQASSIRASKSGALLRRSISSKVSVVAVQIAISYLLWRL